MLIAALEFSDLVVFFVLMAFVAGVAASAAHRDRLRRIEQKLDLMLTKLGIDAPSPEVKDRHGPS